MTTQNAISGARTLGDNNVVFGVTEFNKRISTRTMGVLRVLIRSSGALMWRAGWESMCGRRVVRYSIVTHMGNKIVAV